LYSLCLAGLVLSVGCKKESAQAISTPIKVGAILPLTGDAAAYGLSARQGIDLALANYLKTSPTSPPISIVYEDDRGDAKSGVNAFNKLVDVDGAKVVIGAMASSITLAIAPVAERNHVILISPASSAPEISSAGDFIFRTCYSDEYEGAVLAGYSVKELGLKSFAILRSDNAYGKGLSDQFVKTASDLGATILVSDKFAQGATEFRTQLLKIKTLQPSAVLIIGYKELSNILIQAKQLGITSQFLSSVMFEDPDVIRLAGEAANGVIYTFPAYNTASTNASVQQFVSAYKNAYGKNPDVYAALSYDAADLVFSAITHVGNSPEKVRDYFYGVKDFQGATGSIAFDKNGDVIKELGIKVLRDGKFNWLKDRYKL
jgi:branched-chain amino acid transport system substrate-binding protein